MFEFGGFNDWVEIFAGGQQRSGSGHMHDGDALIDAAINSFDPIKSPVPIVIGHPKHDGPAFGWVDRLNAFFKNGRKVLVAKFKDVVPEFDNLVRQGIYKNRSAAFSPDGHRLRHVGFLGGTPPAVKGLAPVFIDGDDAIEFMAPLAVFEDGAAPVAAGPAGQVNVADPLHARTMAILRNPPGFDKHGRKLEGEMNFSRAFNMACIENPELAREYRESMKNAVYREKIL